MKTALALAFSILVSGCTTPTVWKFQGPDPIGRLAAEVHGAPALRHADGRDAVCFDGKSDGFIVPVNPIEGWPAFTIEVLLRPDGDGPAEQRFLHIQDVKEQRVLIETRVDPGRTWALDTFLRTSDTDKLTLLDRSLTSPTDRWYWVALVFDGQTMSHYVNGTRQLAGKVAFQPMVNGRISLGVRQNLVHWFKGCLAEVRFSPAALAAERLRRN